jgi:hypothetical protein
MDGFCVHGTMETQRDFDIYMVCGFALESSRLIG